MPALERKPQIDWSKSDKWPRTDLVQNNFSATEPTPTLGDVYPQLGELRIELATRDCEKQEHFFDITALMLDGFCITDFQKQIIQTQKKDFSTFLDNFFQGRLDR